MTKTVSGILIYKLALNDGQPLTREEGFFEVATRQTKRMCLIART
jgi:hypothetical protein